MARETMAERFDRLNTRGKELAANKAVGTPQPTAIHVQTIRVLSELLTLGQKHSTGNIPAPLRMMMTTLKRMEPTLIDEMAGVPADQIKEFLGQLVERLNSIINTPDESADDATTQQDNDGSSDQAGRPIASSE